MREEDVRETVRQPAVLVGGKLHELISTNELQDNPHRSRESPPRRITHDLPCSKAGSTKDGVDDIGKQIS